MYDILHKEQLAENVYLMRLAAPLIAEARQAGQFILLSVDAEFGERIPLTIADADTAEGSITIIFQRVGATTTELANLNVGDQLGAIVGPLGSPTHIENFGTAVCVGGGIGVAPLHPIVQALKQAGNKLITIMGARNKELLILEDRMRAMSNELIICTDDGSVGRKCLVTQPLLELCQSDQKPDIVFSIGPPIMMKFCAQTTRPFGVKTMVSLNTIMVDGTGMCGGCRVSIYGKPKFTCVDGPEFDGHGVDFDEFMNRHQAYKEQEKAALEQAHKNHNCRMEAQAAR